ncbi:uncharacterized protein [Rutidosis leptorrhynchoides]|uniref:uncharacterized protein n=1 Tax=Rutidosis leptorrhynchoides TaxID=125765 RepID=UPI003A99D896
MVVEVQNRNQFPLGKSNSKLIWCVWWVIDGKDKLSKLFPRLFRLEQNRAASVTDRVNLNGTDPSFSWYWVRDPAGFVENRGRKAAGYSLIHHDTTRNKLVPKKIVLFIWRAQKKRLQVLVEIDKRGIDLDSIRCPLCDDDLKSVDHVLIFCKYALDIWERVFKWWGFGNFASYSLNELINIDNNVNSSNWGSTTWQTTRWICMYLIWKNRNNKVFNNKCWNGPVALNEIQIMTFEWISNRSRERKIEWLEWLSNPGVFLNIQ